MFSCSKPIEMMMKQKNNFLFSQILNTSQVNVLFTLGFVSNRSSRRETMFFKNCKLKTWKLHIVFVWIQIDNKQPNIFYPDKFLGLRPPHQLQILTASKIFFFSLLSAPFVFISNDIQKIKRKPSWKRVLQF